MVTGASAGVGRACARAFARRGDTVALIARGKDGLEAAAADVRQLGSQPLMLACDVADPDAVEDAAAQVERDAGPIDVWVNNAMATVFSPLQDLSAQEFRRVTEVTYLGSVYGTMAALRRMKPRNAGTVVQVGSALAYRGIPLQSAYCGSKHALRGFYSSVRSELVHDHSKVWISEVHMPALNTPQFRVSRSHMPRKAQPVPPIFQPEVAADAVVYASEHRRRTLWVGAPTAGAVIGGIVAPRLLDQFLGRTNYSAQQIEEAEEPGRADNLWDPVLGDHGAHGPYDDKAHARSPLLALSMHRPLALLGIVAGTGALAARNRLRR